MPEGCIGHSAWWRLSGFLHIRRRSADFFRAAWVERTHALKGSTIRREVILPATPEAALLARAALNDALPTRALGSRRDHARLVMSELVTNAVKHGAENGQDVLRVTIEVFGESLRVEIEQPGRTPDLSPVEPRLYGQDFGGLGLYIVDELADDWGAEPGPPGHVWFEFLTL